MNKQIYNINDYIGVFDNFMDNSSCDKLIKWFHEQESYHKVHSRIVAEQTTQEIKNDFATDVRPDNFHTLFKDRTPDSFSITMNNIFEIYNRETNIMKYIGLDELHWDHYKVQKTCPSGGYHVWHVEQNPCNHHTVNRVLVFTLYLNDVEEGGETEFLLQSQRVSAKKGRVCVFPAYFPFVHRGNPPLKEDKYIATGWLFGTSIITSPKN